MLDKINDLAFGDYKRTRPQILEDILDYAQTLKTRLIAAFEIYGDSRFYLLEYGGPGDSLHTKLWIQHAERHLKQRVLLITNSHTCSLLQDDKSLDTFDHTLFNRYRNPTFEFVTYGMSEVFNVVFNDVMKKVGKLDMSRAISRIHYKNQFLQAFGSLADPYYIGTNMVRDMGMKHVIEHHGERSNKRQYVCLETGSISFGNQNPSPVFYNEVVERIREYCSVVLVGGPDDFCPDDCKDLRGMSYYDTFSYIKGCSLFIGRNSANQGLTVFTPHIPVIDINSSDYPTLRFDATGYRTEKNHFIRTHNGDTVDDLMRIVDAYL